VGPRWAEIQRILETAAVSTTCQQVVSSDFTRGLASLHGALFGAVIRQG